MAGDHSLVNGLCGVFSGAPVPTPFLLNLSSHSAPLINYLPSLTALEIGNNNLTGCVPAALSGRLRSLGTDGLEYC